MQILKNVIALERELKEKVSLACKCTCMVCFRLHDYILKNCFVPISPNSRVNVQKFTKDKAGNFHRT